MVGLSCSFAKLSLWINVVEITPLIKRKLKYIAPTIKRQDLLTTKDDEQDVSKNELEL